MATVREFIFQAYRLISASNPTSPLRGDDEKVGIQVMNQLLEYFAATGLLITIAKTKSVSVTSAQNKVIFTSPTYTLTDTIREVVALTTGLATFTSTNGSLYNVGDLVAGTGIPSGTSILSIAGNVITLSANATTTGNSNLIFTQDTSDPTASYIQFGRLSNLDSAWLLLDGVTYPLIDESRNSFFAAWKYEPLQGLPRFVIVLPDTETVTMQLYPAPSQQYEVFVRAKLQLNELTSNDSMNLVPAYALRHLLLATAKDVAMYKGRSEAWTEKLEGMLIEARDTMEAASEVNLAITGDGDSLLNGANRVRAGV